jgi:hypothetical protein
MIDVGDSRRQHCMAAKIRRCKLSFHVDHLVAHGALQRAPRATDRGIFAARVRHGMLRRSLHYLFDAGALLPLAPHLQQLLPQPYTSCLCGSGKKFRFCCSSGLSSATSSWNSQTRAFLAAGKSELALADARLEFSRYRLWHEGQTLNPRTPKAARDELFKIDIDALSELLDNLMRCYDACGIRSEFRAVIERVADAIDDPRWREATLLQRAVWALGPTWDEDAAKVELRGKVEPGTTRNAELLALYLDVFSDELGIDASRKLIASILAETDNPAVRLQYRVIEAIGSLLAGDEENALKMVEGAIATFEAEITPGYEDDFGLFQYASAQALGPVFKPAKPGFLR